MPKLDEYRGLHVAKKAADPADPSAVWFVDHETGAMSLKPFSHATFLNELSQPTDEAPAKIVLGIDYVEREPWIEQVGLDRKIIPAGPEQDPMSQVHNVPECEALVLHMLQADFVYKVVQQPGRQADGTVTQYYLAELENTQDPTGHDTTKGWYRIPGTGSGSRAAEYVSVVAV